MKKLIKMISVTLILIYGVLINVNADTIIQKSNVELNKEWTIKFNKDLDESTVNESNIYIKDKDDNVFTSIITLTNKRNIVIIPKQNYEANSSYNITVSNAIKSEDGKHLNNEFKMKFTTINEDKNTDDIFKKEDIDKYLSTNFVEVENGTVYFNESGRGKSNLKHYKPESQYNSKMNDQIYNLLKSRLEDNERENYTTAKYSRYPEGNHSAIYIAIAQSKRAFYPLYAFKFEEKNINKKTNPYNAYMRLTVNMLGDSNSENSLYDKYYVKRLEKDLEVLFEESIGSEIFTYIDKEYQYTSKLLVEHKEKPFEHIKKIDNLTVYSVLNSMNYLDFYFIQDEKEI